MSNNPALVGGLGAARVGFMLGVVFWVVIGVAVVCIVIAVVIYAQVYRRGRRLGTKGIVQRSHLTCPKCHQEFDYDWIPGGSLRTVRLGYSRYMRCPVCRRWSTFDVYHTMVARVGPSASGAGPPPPR